MAGKVLPQIFCDLKYPDTRNKLETKAWLITVQKMFVAGVATLIWSYANSNNRRVGDYGLPLALVSVFPFSKEAAILTFGMICGVRGASLLYRLFREGNLNLTISAAITLFSVYICLNQYREKFCFPFTDRSIGSWDLLHPVFTSIAERTAPYMMHRS